MFGSRLSQVLLVVAWAISASAAARNSGNFNVLFTSKNQTIDGLGLDFIRNPGFSTKGGLVATEQGDMGKKGITWSIRNGTYLGHYNQIEPADYGFIHLTTKQPMNVPKGYLYAEFNFLEETPGFTAKPQPGYSPIHFDPAVSGVSWKTFAVCTNSDYRSTGDKVLQVLYRPVGSVPDKTGQCSDVKLNAVLYY